MASQYPTSLKSIVGAALVELGLNGAATPLCHLFCAITREALGILPYLVLAAWQASWAFAFDHQRLLEILGHCVSFWSLIDTTGRML
jgi:hypothetical protein